MLLGSAPKEVNSECERPGLTFRVCNHWRLSLGRRMPRIFDNIDLYLRPTLSETLAHSVRLDACVGYFNLRGWDALAADADRLVGADGQPPVRVLIGMQDRPDSRLRDALRIVRRAETMDNQTAAACCR